MRWLGNLVRVVVLGICVATVFVGVSRAQFGGKGPPQPPPIQKPNFPKPPVMPPIQKPPPVMPPIQKPPIQQPPRFNQPDEIEWYCTRCRGVLARGGPEPVHIQTCPHCGARFVGGGGPNFNQGPVDPMPNDPEPILHPAEPVANPRVPANNNSGSRILIGVLVGGVALAIFAGCAIVGLVLVLNSGTSSKPAKKRRRRPRDDDDDDDY